MTTGATMRYSVVAVFFHWIIALLILANIPLGLFNHQIEAAYGHSPMWIHKSIGLTILVLTLLRLGWRLAHPAPPLPQTVPAWQVGLSRLVHGLLYALLLVVPLSGWIRVSAGTYPLTWFALFPVPKFDVARGSAVAHIASDMHDITALAMLGLLTLHIVAALYHHFLMRDAVLVRMLPRALRP